MRDMTLDARGAFIATGLCLFVAGIPWSAFLSGWLDLAPVLFLAGLICVGVGGAGVRP